MKAAKVEAKTSPPVAILQPTSPELLQWEMQQTGVAIARRAYEIFNARNGEHGHDWEDWFQAESELLRPVSIAMSESANRISVRINIEGFSEHELKVGIEPQGVTIVGRKESKPTSSGEQTTPNQVLPNQVLPNQVLRCIPLTSEIDIAGAVIELDAGVLKLELPKVAAAEAKAAGAGTVR